MNSFYRMWLELTFCGGRLESPPGCMTGFAFAASCAMFAELFMFLDLCIFYIRRRSFLQFKYRFRHGVGLFLAVPAAAAVIGLLGVYLDILQTSRAACIAVGFGWPFLLAAFFNATEGIGPSREDPESGKALV